MHRPEEGEPPYPYKSHPGHDNRSTSRMADVCQELNLFVQEKRCTLYYLQLFRLTAYLMENMLFSFPEQVALCGLTGNE